MAYKADKYSSKSDIDEMDVLTEKLAQDLRHSIRQLVSCSHIEAIGMVSVSLVLYSCCVFVGNFSDTL